MHQVSFAPDGKQVLVIDRDGNRHEALILPGQSTELVKMLTTKGITFAVQSNAPQSEVSGLLSVLPSILLPVAIIGGLFFLQRRNQEGGGGGMGGMGGPGGPMGMGKSKSKIQMEVPRQFRHRKIGPSPLLPKSHLPPIRSTLSIPLSLLR